MLKIIPIVFVSFVLSITRSDIYDDSWALLIGINEYKTVTPNLNYAVDDAQDLKELLVAQFGFSENKVTILKNQEATKYNIEKELGKLRRKTKENDRVLIFFAGHGQTYELPEGGEMGFLLPYDSDVEDLYLSSIPMTDLKQQANTFKAKHVLFMVDACYGGLSAVGSRSLDIETPNYIERISKDKSRQVITAGGKGEEVVEKGEWGHSAFTMNLLRGLKGRADYNADGAITTNELYMFLKETVTQDSGYEQTPQTGRYTSHEGEFVFIYSDNVTINQVSTNTNNGSSAPSSQIDYDLLASKIAQEMKQESAPPIVPVVPSTDKEREEQILATMFNDMPDIPTFLDEENYSNGITKYKHNYNPEKKRHGSQSGYYSNSIPKYEYNFLMGKPHGKQIGYYSNGIPKYEYNFLMGKPHGAQIKYRSNGIKKSESFYAKGKLMTGSKIEIDDMHEMYGSNGNDISIGDEDGILIGEDGINIGDEDGILIGEDGINIGDEDGISIGEDGINIGDEDGISIGQDGISIGGEDGINLDFSKWKENFAQEDEDSDEDEGDSHSPDRSWHMITSSSTMLESGNEFDQFSSFLFGVSYDIKPDLDLQIGYNMIHDDSDNFESKGLRLGLRFNIIEDVLKGQVGSTIGYAEYEYDTGSAWGSEGEVNYLFDFGVIVDILFFDVLFSVDYNLNDMMSGVHQGYNVINGPCFTIGLEIFPWD